MSEHQASERHTQPLSPASLHYSAHPYLSLIFIRARSQAFQFEVHPSCKKISRFFSPRARQLMITSACSERAHARRVRARSAAAPSPHRPADSRKTRLRIIASISDGDEPVAATAPVPRPATLRRCVLILRHLRQCYPFCAISPASAFSPGPDMFWPESDRFRQPMIGCHAGHRYGLAQIFLSSAIISESDLRRAEVLR